MYRYYRIWSLWYVHVEQTRLKKRNNFEYPYLIDSNNGEILDTRICYKIKIEYDNDGE